MRKVSIVDSQVFGLIPKNSKSKSIANFIQRLAPLNSAVNPIIYCMVSANNSYIWTGKKIRGRTNGQTEVICVWRKLLQLLRLLWTDTYMVKYGLSLTLASSPSFWLELVSTHPRTLTSMNSSGLVSRAGSVTLAKTLTPIDSYGLSWTLAASSSFWLELGSTHPRTLTPMNSYGLLGSFL